MNVLAIDIGGTHVKIHRDASVARFTEKDMTKGAAA
jgi:hypothetical protein